MTHQERIAARSVVAREIASGRLSRPSCCGQCGGDGEPIQAHHADYSKPLDVEWLCRSCHWARHTKQPIETVGTTFLTPFALWKRLRNHATDAQMSQQQIWIDALAEYLDQRRVA